MLLEPNQLGKTATKDIRSSQPGANRAFLSGLPATLEADGGVPEWAHGMVVSAVAPPMLTVDRLPAQLRWIDPLVQMSVVRADDPTVLATIDLPLRSRPGRSFAIGAGSVWFASGALAVGSSGGFAGLRVKSGTLTVDMDVTFTDFKAHLPVGATATLQLEIEQPTDVSVQFPKSILIVWAPDKVSLSANGAATVTAFGVRVGLTPATGAVAYDNATHDLTVPLTPDTARFSPVASDSVIAAVDGMAPISAALWAIPVAFAAATNLGQAAGAGAIRLILGDGIALTIPTLNLRTPVRGVAISVGTDLLQLTGQLAQHLTAEVQLWDEQGGVSGVRTSSILFSAKPGDQVLWRVEVSTELVSILGACTASVDRPLTSAGTRLGLSFPMALLAVTRTTAGISAYVIGNQTTAEHPERHSLVLENALLIVDGPQTLVATGPIDDARLRSGSLRLTFPMFDVVATLPDPYAASTSEQRRASNLIVDVLTVAMQWSPEGAATLEVTSKGVGPTPGVVSGRQPDMLLDVSTNADLFGVRMIEGGGARVDASILSASGASLALFTVPGVSWEPVEFNDAAITIDPPPNDGQPTVIRVESVRLVPVEPLPVLSAFVDMTKAGASAAMRFMLPFGLVADASLPANSIRDQGSAFELVMPAFDQGMIGGHQLTLRPPNPTSLIAGFPGSVSAAGPGAKQVLGSSVFSIFDGQFGPSAGNRMVPVRRVDISGYGNSMFSDWLDTATDAGVPAVAEARFDVIVGRTSYEVIQVVSVIYPWAIRTVRTITMARQDGGRILRSDTGWLALSDGNFDLPPGIVSHKGAVTRVTNVHNIKEQGPELVLDSTAPGLDFQPVTFDADALINPDLGVPDGGVNSSTGTVVPSKGMNGFMQLKPNKQFISAAQLRTLMQDRPVGGALACSVDLGGPGVGGPLVRVTGVGVSTADTPAAPEIVVTLMGTPRLPSNGSWSVGRLSPGDTAPNALKPDAAVPLIRQNGNPDWHFADPQDIDRLTAPQATQYGLIQGTGTQRAFFRQPRVAKGSSQVDLGQPPHLADVSSLLNATGVFPDLTNALKFDKPPQINLVGDSLTVQRHRFSLAGVPPRTLLEITPVKILLDYADADGQAAFVDFEIEPSGSPIWTVAIGTVSILLVLPPFGTQSDPLLRLTGSIHADSRSAPNYKDLVVHFGGSMSLIQQVFTRLQELAKMLPGGSANLDVSFSDGRLTIRDGFTLPNLPLGLGQITNVGMDLGLTVSLGPPAVSFQVGIGTPDKPFHWLVSPLSGTGAVVVGSQDGRPTILILGGIGVGLAIDVGIASGSASVVLALQVDNRVAPLELKIILTGQAAIDVLEGLASATITLSAAMGIAPDALPIPHELTLFADVAVGIHLSLCWVASIDFDGSWHVQQTLTSPIS
ncbi:hypothetical protein [Bradyrhizobium sp. McL0616]|uniref:hypothetical protein n=1 Tax=Bradyrhizobium sp. McL0616 TaxID=3415674 RepID=UPI003CF71437